MVFVAMTDKAIAKEMGGRLKALRLRLNMKQKDVAESSGLSITAVQGAEKGETTIVTLVKVLRALDSLETLDAFIPEPEISPLALAKLEGKKRKRAS